MRDNASLLKILALIPARSGSKGIPKKNIADLGGYPLIAYSICAARLSKYINRVIVSTDDPAIAAIAESFGAEAPFLRPKSISGDNSLDIDFFRHALKWLKRNENYVPDLIVHLRPSTPLRDAGVIDRAIYDVLRDKRASALRSAEIFNAGPPYKLFRKEGHYCHFFGKEDFNSGEEYYNYPRQMFPLIYCPNGYVDIVLPRILTGIGSLHGKKIRAFITDKIIDIDSIDDLIKARKLRSTIVYKRLTDAMRRITSGNGTKT